MDSVETQDYGVARKPAVSLDSVPIELVRMIFRACDGPTTRNLRLASVKFARVGEPFLLPADFETVSRRKGGRRLLAIANHERLGSGIESVTFKLGGLFRRLSSEGLLSGDQPGPDAPEEMTIADWEYYAGMASAEAKRLCDAHGDGRIPLYHAFSQLPNLRHVQVALARATPDGNLLSHLSAIPGYMDRLSTDALETLYELPEAMDKAHVTSFTCDRLPMEIFRTSASRKKWFIYPGAFAHLTRLDLMLDLQDDFNPHARFRAAQGLGYVLRLSTKLTHLALEFVDYGSPRLRVPLEFRELLDDDFTSNFAFRYLTDLKLAGISCSELDIRKFLTRHSGTLERLQLGSLGLAPGDARISGGLHIHSGSFRSLFTTLRTKLLVLKQLRLLGAFMSRGEDMASEEHYRFIPDGGCALASYTDPLPFERYVLKGGVYPGRSIG